MTPIAPLIETFLRDTLARQRGASRHTSNSYALGFQLLFVFAAEQLGVKTSMLALEQIDAGLISTFLELRWSRLVGQFGDFGARIAAALAEVG